jgi:hypothetical protein
MVKSLQKQRFYHSERHFWWVNLSSKLCSPGGKLINRKIVAAALSFAVLLGTSACSLKSEVPTLQMYAPSEGIDGDLASVALRNFIYLSNGTNSVLIGSAINTTGETVTFNLQFGDSAERAIVEITLQPYEKLDIGYNGNASVNIPAPGKPGDVVSIFAAEPGATAIRLNVPVLDGRLEQYADLVNAIDSETLSPSAEPTATAEPTPSPTPSGN